MMTDTEARRLARELVSKLGVDAAERLIEASAGLSRGRGERLAKSRAIDPADVTVRRLDGTIDKRASDQALLKSLLSPERVSYAHPGAAASSARPVLDAGPALLSKLLHPSRAVYFG